MSHAIEFYVDDEYKTLINVGDNIHYEKEKKYISEQEFINTYDFDKLPKIFTVPKHKIRWTIIMKFKNENGPFKNIYDFCNRMTNCSKIGLRTSKKFSLILKKIFSLKKKI